MWRRGTTTESNKQLTKHVTTEDKNTTTNGTESVGNKTVLNEIEHVEKLRKAVDRHADCHSKVGGEATLVGTRSRSGAHTPKAREGLQRYKANPLGNPSEAWTLKTESWHKHMHKHREHMHK